MRKVKPPTETYEYVGSKKVGFCDQCKSPIYELATFKGERFSLNKGGIDWLFNYVKKKLCDSGVIPEDAIATITNHIVHTALREGTYKYPDRYVPDGKGGWKLVKGKFACIDRADREIEWRIKYPPPPISRTRFSLKAFVKSNPPFFGVKNSAKASFGALSRVWKTHRGCRFLR